jgi:hypothetical protein
MMDVSCAFSRQLLIGDLPSAVDIKQTVSGLDVVVNDAATPRSTRHTCPLGQGECHTCYAGHSADTVFLSTGDKLDADEARKRANKKRRGFVSVPFSTVFTPAGLITWRGSVFSKKFWPHYEENQRLRI